jgi:rod shape-determining protein MreC
MRLFIAVLVSVALLITEYRSDYLLPLRASLSLLTDPIKYLVNLPCVVYQDINDLLNLQKENVALKQEQLIDKTQLLKFEALEKENIRLRALLENSFKLGDQVLVAEMLSITLMPYEHLMVVNKGTHFGVHPQQPVLDANGVVGQVFRALPFTSEIMLITDPNHAIPVQVNRNGLLTIAVGSGMTNQLTLPYLPTNADIQPGDLLITSGLGGTFPAGYPVGVVDKFPLAADKSITHITATPKALLDRNRELLIVWSNNAIVPLTTPAIQTPQPHE